MQAVNQTAKSQAAALDVVTLAKQAKAAGTAIANTSTAKKNAVLTRVARAISRTASQAILDANQRDMQVGRDKGLSAAMLDRLRLDQARLEGIAEAIEAIVELPDPVGEVINLHSTPSGIEVGRMRIPLGLILIIYESRPNVTADAATLCLKSGNACILRGGSESLHSNQALAAVFTDALKAEGLPSEAVTLVPTTDRQAMLELLGLDGIIDLVIPRGGEQLIRYVAEHARIPVVRHYKGVCHVYVDSEADFDMAERIVLNAKVQRPGVCNAMETLLIDRACSKSFLPRIVQALKAKGVEIRGDAAVKTLVTDVRAATEADFDTEHLDLIVSIALVDGLDGALAHIAKHGSNHTEAIITTNKNKAARWTREVDASCVLVNASTRFNDGGQLGLGAEIGISTTKMHAYGPMGLQELCALKWIGYGTGQIRT